MTPMNGETEAKAAFKEEYHRYILRKIFILAALAAGTVLLAGLFSVSSFEGITLGESYTIIWNHITGVTYEPRSLYWWADQYIWNSAMPRVCIAVVAGACATSLALSGAEYVFRRLTGHKAVIYRLGATAGGIPLGPGIALTTLTVLLLGRH